MNLAEILALAAKHIGSGTMVSSAQLCLADAYLLKTQGAKTYAARRAVKSLAYSVGIFHSDYQAADAASYSLYREEQARDAR